jgi:hypothetical protein
MDDLLIKPIFFFFYKKGGLNKRKDFFVKKYIEFFSLLGCGGEIEWEGKSIT